MNAIVRTPPDVDGIEVFRFGGHSIRIVRVEVDGKVEPWFVASDVCTALRLTNPSVSLKALDPDERSKKFLGGRQGEVLIVSESGLTSLIMRCQKATVIGSTAHQFRKWVTKDVLPSIRRTGSYGTPVATPAAALALLQDTPTLIALLGTYAQRTLALETENRDLSTSLAVSSATIEAQAPIVEAYEEIVDADGSLCITDAAKSIGVTRSVLSAHMRDRERKAGWIYGRPGVDEVAYQPRLDRGELVHKIVPIRRSSGEVEAKPQVRVTAKGLFILRAELVQKERDRRKAAGEFDL